MSAQGPDEPSPWVTVSEAARRLGTTVEAVRKRIGRGQLNSRKGNDGRTEVLVLTESARSPPADPTTSAHEPDTVRKLSGLEEEVSGLRDEADRWRAKAEEAGQRAARAEGELTAKDALVTTLREALTHERAEKARLAGELAEARRPWLAKVLEGWRRRGS
jgi:predicted RNase H-like nuclease (RuvC/YqgF family)